MCHLRAMRPSSNTCSRWPAHIKQHPLNTMLCATQPTCPCCLQALTKAMEDGMEFDSSRLVNFSERILFNSAAAQHTPLLQEGGRLVVTDQYIYFQPLHNISGPSGSPGPAAGSCEQASSKHRASSSSTSAAAAACFLCTRPNAGIGGSI